MLPTDVGFLKLGFILQQLAKQTNNYSAAEIAALVRAAVAGALKPYFKITNTVEVDMMGAGEMKVELKDFSDALKNIKPVYKYICIKEIINTSNFNHIIEIRLSATVVSLLTTSPRKESLTGENLSKSLLTDCWKSSIEFSRDLVFNYISIFLFPNYLMFNSLFSVVASVLMEGPSGAGKTALAAHFSKLFPVVQICTPHTMLDFSEDSKSAHICKVRMVVKSITIFFYKMRFCVYSFYAMQPVWKPVVFL